MDLLVTILLWKEETKMNVQNTKEFQSWFEKANHIVSTDSDMELEFKEGKKYIKIMTRNKVNKDMKSAYGFIDNEGNVYMAASWNVPAKHTRGNIFNEDNGISCVGKYGISYLK